jgi:hypothetical protein
MANPDLPDGFRAAGAINRIGRYERDAASAAPICPGDIVQVDADGNINEATAGNTGLVGVALSFATGSAANTNILVADDPDQVFIGQDDGDSTTPAQTHVGNNANVLATNGSVSPIRSNHEIDISTVTTVVENLALLSFIQSPEYTVGANSLWEVMIAEHIWDTAAGI